MHHHEYKDKVFVLESKESIMRLSKSPDIRLCIDGLFTN